MKKENYSERNSIHLMGKEVLSLKETAYLLNVSVDTIRRSIKSGFLKGFQINKAGNWKITTEEIKRLMRDTKNE